MFHPLLTEAQLIVIDLPPRAFDEFALTPEQLYALNPNLVVVAITPFGLTGPRRDYLGGDLGTFHASGLARIFTGRSRMWSGNLPCGPRASSRTSSSAGA